MRLPVCICNGVIRSGSTWSFNVCRELYRQAAMAMKNRFESAYIDSAGLEQFIARPWAGISALTVFKAHDIGPVALKALRQGTAKAICTYRDPRDCVASDMAFSKNPFEICIKRISGTLEPIRIYQSTSNVLMIRYEDMMQDPIPQIHRIAKHMGLGVDDAMVQWIDSQTNFVTSQKVCQSLKDKPAGQVLQMTDHRVDPTTHLHDNHINGGTIGRWKDEFSSDQIAFMTEYFEPWLIKLGYETQQSLQVLLNTSNVDPGRWITTRAQQYNTAATTNPAPAQALL